MRVVNGVVQVNGAAFDYVQFGGGEEQLVMIPGLGDGLTTVKGKALLGEAMFRPFTRDYRITILSRKRVLEPHCTTESMAHDQAAAMRALGIQRAHIVGVSQGGMIAQHLAYEYPELVDRLVLVVTVPKSNERLTDVCLRWKRLAQANRYKDLMIDLTELSHPEPYIQKARKLYPFAGFGRPKSFTRFYLQANACMTHDAEKKLPFITAPTLIIGGGQDRVLGPEGSYALHEAIPGSRLHIYPQLGHALDEDAPDFPGRVMAFLQGLR